jgi:hypothetical protein
MEQSRVALSENIAFLSSLLKNRRALEEPSINALKGQKGIAQDRPGLSFDEEKRTAEAFALLLATTDDRDAIGAVCIEQNPYNSAMILRTAVNSGPQQSRKEVFRRLIDAAKLSLPPSMYPSRAILRCRV